jgi:hypothetical protein
VLNTVALKNGMRVVREDYYNLKTNNNDDILVTSYNNNTSSLSRRDSDRARRYA